MHALLQLVAGLFPLVAFGAISPVVVLNASTAVSTQGQRGGWRFVAGMASVLAVLGVAFVGLLGTSASQFATREIASRVVDRCLGALLLCYALRLAWTMAHRRRVADDDARAQQPQERDMFTWGLLGMATNFTTLPLFASASQRIGAADIGWWERLPVLLVVMVGVLAPAWVPVVVARLRPQRGDISAATRARVARWTSLVSVGACFVGAAVLLWTSR